MGGIGGERWNGWVGGGVRLPEDQWPEQWKGKDVDPVVPLVLALYGHPDAGVIGNNSVISTCVNRDLNLLDRNGDLVIFTTN